MKVNSSRKSDAYGLFNKINRLFGRSANLLCIGATVLFILSIIFMLSGIQSLFVGNNSQIYLYGDGVKYVEIENGYVINELVLESGSALPSTRDYFNENYKLGNNVSIKYFNMNDDEIHEDDFTVTVNDTKFVKGIQDIIVQIINDNNTYDASVSIQDTTTPEVTVGNFTIKQGEEYSPKDFIVFYFDNSSDENYIANFVGDNEYNEIGTHDINLEICDMADNCVEASASLEIIEPDPEPEPEKPVVTQVPNKSGTTKQVVSQKNPNSNSTGGGSNNNSGGNTGSGNTGNNNGNSGNNNNNNNNNNLPNKDYNNNNVNNANSSQKSNDPVFLELVEKAKAYYANPNNASEIQHVQDTFIRRTNEARRAAGVPELELDETLNLLAQVRIREYESLGWDESLTYMHKRPDGRDFSTVFKDYGYVAGVTSNGMRYYGENYVSVLYGPNYSNDGAYTLLHNSPGHYANIVSPCFTKMGIAKGINPVTKRYYWIQLFAS